MVGFIGEPPSDIAEIGRKQWGNGRDRFIDLIPSVFIVTVEID